MCRFDKRGTQGKRKRGEGWAQGWRGNGPGCRCSLWCSSWRCEGHPCRCRRRPRRVSWRCIERWRAREMDGQRLDGRGHGGGGVRSEGGEGPATGGCERAKVRLMVVRKDNGRISPPLTRNYKGFSIPPFNNDHLERHQLLKRAYHQRSRPPQTTSASLLPSTSIARHRCLLTAPRRRRRTFHPSSLSTHLSSLSLSPRGATPYPNNEAKPTDPSSRPPTARPWVTPSPQHASPFSASRATAFFKTVAT